jgi:serine/threonine protein kinase
MSSEPPARGERQALIGRYEVMQRIGAGGMGAVYRAVHLDLGREVALKVLPPELAARPEMLQRFIREAQHAAKLRHEHIVTLYEFGEASGTHYLAMEFVDGIDLHEYIDEKGQLDPEEARMIAIQAAKALALAHKEGIVHRDIKPSNFLITRREGKLVVKLTDFGLALSLEDSDFRVTRSGSTIGTVDYISPEQARNSRAADVRSDIYSLGCTLYHMLTGQAPFSQGDLTERLLKHVEAEPPDVKSFNPKIPDGLVAVLKRMLAKKPDDRYQTPAELLQDLEHLPRGTSSSALWNSRELLEGLALADGEQPAKPIKPARAAKPALSETRKVALERTKLIDARPTPAPAPKPRYRDGGLRKGRLEEEPVDEEASEGLPALLMSWQTWVAILGTLIIILAMILVGLLIQRGRQSAAAVGEVQTQLLRHLQTAQILPASADLAQLGTANDRRTTW